MLASRLCELIGLFIPPFAAVTTDEEAEAAVGDSDGKWAARIGEGGACCVCAEPACDDEEPPDEIEVDGLLVVCAEDSDRCRRWKGILASM